MTRKTVKSGMIAPDDLRVGAFVVIHSSKAVEHPASNDFEMFVRGDSVRSMPVPPLGMALEVMGVNLPYVLVSSVTPSSQPSRLTTVDLRLVNLMHVNKAFVNAIRAFKPAPPARPVAGDEAATSDDPLSEAIP